MSDYTSAYDDYTTTLNKVAFRLKHLEQLRRYVMICGISRSLN